MACSTPVSQPSLDVFCGGPWSGGQAPWSRGLNLWFRVLALSALLALPCVSSGCISPASPEAVPPSALATTQAPLYTIAITDAPARLAVGHEQVLTAEATFRGGSHAVVTQSVTWASSDPKVARAEASGRIIGVAPGKATIKATQGEASGAAEVEVVAP
jgi:Bacterial Ig-like domain (group 2)